MLVFLLYFNLREFKPSILEPNNDTLTSQLNWIVKDVVGRIYVGCKKEGQLNPNHLSFQFNRLCCSSP